MPFGRLEILQLLVLILIVPAQYFISHYLTSSSESNAQLNIIINKLDYFLKCCFAPVQESSVFLQKLISSIFNYQNLKDEKIEVPLPIKHVIFFGGSSIPRSPRPQHVKYRIGQVIRHKHYGYKGVIIGWDPTTLAPDYWLQSFYQNRKDIIKLPSYSVLVDNRDRDRLHRTYVNEENIEILTNTKVIHAEVDNYFESFDGIRYIPRPKLRVIYPHD